MEKNQTNNKPRMFFSEEMGYSVFAKTLGVAWMGSVECVLKNGQYEPDESRNRVALQCFHIKSETQELPDEVIKKYASKENVDAMTSLVFTEDTMRDFDVTTNFRAGAKSYKARLEEGKLVEFVVDRLTKIPESKKAVIVFPTYNDYEQVKNSPYNDYFPCITSIQFRLRPEKNGVRKLNTILNMRSWNIDQKGAGDLVICAMLNHKVCEELNKKLDTNVEPGSLDGFISDIHIYQNTIESADAVVSRFNTDLAMFSVGTENDRKVIKKSAAIIIKDRKVLYLRKKDFPYYILPGGRMEIGEGKSDTLHREMLEELSTDVEVEKELGIIKGKGVSVEKNELNDVEITLYKVKTPLEIKLASEIYDMDYVTYAELHKFSMTPIGIKTVGFLHDQGLID